MRLINHALNAHVRLLDGQWQGTIVASDGNVYFGGGSHNLELGAALFRYEPKSGKVAILKENITTACGEDPRKTPPQGKIHSPVVEHDGWIYFGTHPANYTEQGRKAYPGAHLVGYQLSTGRFRDYGEIADLAGRRPMWAGDRVTDGRGMVYMVGRWEVPETDMRTIGVLRHGTRMAVFFSVMDVRDDLQRITKR